MIEIKNLTKKYKKNIVLENISLAEKIAKSRKKKLSQVSYDELKSAAYLGLVEAANKSALGFTKGE